MHCLNGVCLSCQHLELWARFDLCFLARSLQYLQSDPCNRQTHMPYANRRDLGCWEYGLECTACLSLLYSVFVLPVKVSYHLPASMVRILVSSKRDLIKYYTFYAYIWEYCHWCQTISRSARAAILDDHLSSCFSLSRYIYNEKKQICPSMRIWLWVQLTQLSEPRSK